MKNISKIALLSTVAACVGIASPLTFACNWGKGTCVQIVNRTDCKINSTNKVVLNNITPVTEYLRDYSGYPCQATSQHSCSANSTDTQGHKAKWWLTLLLGGNTYPIIKQNFPTRFFESLDKNTDIDYVAIYSEKEKQDVLFAVNTSERPLTEYCKNLKANDIKILPTS